MSCRSKTLHATLMSLVGLVLAFCLGLTWLPVPLYAEEASASGSTDMTLHALNGTAPSFEEESETPTTLAKTGDTTTAAPVIAALGATAGLACARQRLRRTDTQAGDRK